MHSSRRLSGFTIVELLIVIVVIAILAAIVIVTYQGVQRQASNSSKYSAAETYVKALQSYVITNGQYPPISAGSACLGKGYVSNTCGSNTFPTYDDSGFDTALQKFIGSMPNGDSQVITKQDGSTYVGITITNWSGFNLNGVSNPYFIEYVLYGSNQDCKISGLVQIRSGWGDFVPATTQKNTFYDSASTSCVVALPNPGST